MAIKVNEEGTLKDVSSAVTGLSFKKVSIKYNGILKNMSNISGGTDVGVLDTTNYASTWKYIIFVFYPDWNRGGSNQYSICLPNSSNIISYSAMQNLTYMGANSTGNSTEMFWQQGHQAIFILDRAIHFKWMSSSYSYRDYHGCYHLNGGLFVSTNLSTFTKYILLRLSYINDYGSSKVSSISSSTVKTIDASTVNVKVIVLE